jgi:hypothetical protein
VVRFDGCGDRTCETDLLAREVFVLGNTENVELDAQQEGNEAAALRHKRLAALYVDWSNGMQRPRAAVTESDASEQIDATARGLEVATAMTAEYRALTAERARELIAEARQAGLRRS